MTDLYLKAADEAAAFAALLPFGYARSTEAGPRWIATHEAFALDAGVPVIATPPVFDGNGALIAPAVFEPGFFLNIRLAAGEDARATALFATGLVLDPAPVTPARVWA